MIGIIISVILEIFSGVFFKNHFLLKNMDSFMSSAL